MSHGIFSQVQAQALPCQNIINPHDTSLIRLRLWINACLFQLLLEIWVGESEISSNAMVEGVVAGRFIVVAAR